ncbi:MAG: metallophosphoesterase family protein [Myxococcales bacterium]|nr:metallophosphoesterase family protein [Myxococcales bacterium]
MSVVLVSDLHLQGPTDPTQIELLAFLREARFEELVVVGDLFDVWLAPPGRVPRDAAPVVDVLRELGATWLGGNHDPSPRVPGLRTARRWRRDGVLAVHGDDGEGPAHHAVRALLGSRTVGRVAGGIGVDRVFALGRVASGLRRKAHDEAGQRRALAVQTALVDRWLLSADTVVVGHTHAPGVMERPGGRLVNLGDWYEHRTFGRLEHGRVRLLHWRDGEEVELDGPPRRRPELLR